MNDGKEKNSYKKVSELPPQEQLALETMYVARMNKYYHQKNAKILLWFNYFVLIFSLFGLFLPVLQPALPFAFLHQYISLFSGAIGLGVVACAIGRFAQKETWHRENAITYNTLELELSMMAEGMRLNQKPLLEYLQEQIILRGRVETKAEYKKQEKQVHKEAVAYGHRDPERKYGDPVRVN